MEGRPSECYDLGASPEEHIAKIRLQLFGIGRPRQGEDSNTVESVEGVRQLSRHAHDTNEGIAKLAMAAHSSPFHFLCEILQNVSDSQRRLLELSKRKAAAPHCSLEITLTYEDFNFDDSGEVQSESKPLNVEEDDDSSVGGSLLMIYDEPGWSNCDVEAVVKARESTKKSGADLEYIGEKGQGFYSVFRVAVEAVILSAQTHEYSDSTQSLVPKANPDKNRSFPLGGYFFALTRRMCPMSGFKYVVPRWVGSQAIPKQVARLLMGRTALCLRLGAVAKIDEVFSRPKRKGTATSVVRQLRETLIEFPEETLLFLTSPDKMTITYPRTNPPSVSLRVTGHPCKWRRVEIAKKLRSSLERSEKDASLSSYFLAKARDYTRQHEALSAHIYSIMSDTVDLEELVAIRAESGARASELGSSRTLVENIYLRVRNSLAVPKPVSRVTPARANAKRRQIEIVFPVSSVVSQRGTRTDQTLKQGRWSVFACLPVELEQSGLGGVVNADFLLTASREQLDRGPASIAWNDFLIDEIPRAYTQALCCLSRTTFFPCLPSYLPSFGGSNRGASSALISLSTHVLRRLADAEVIPVGRGERVEWAKPGSSLIFDDQILSLWQDCVGEERVAQFCIAHTLVHEALIPADDAEAQAKIAALTRCGVRLLLSVTTDQLTLLFEELLSDVQFVAGSVKMSCHWWSQLLRHLSSLLLVADDLPIESPEPNGSGRLSARALCRRVCEAPKVASFWHAVEKRSRDCTENELAWTPGAKEQLQNSLESIDALFRDTLSKGTSDAQLQIRRLLQTKLMLPLHRGGSCSASECKALCYLECVRPGGEEAVEKVLSEIEQTESSVATVFKQHDEGDCWRQCFNLSIASLMPAFVHPNLYLQTRKDLQLTGPQHLGRQDGSGSRGSSQAVDTALMQRVLDIVFGVSRFSADSLVTKVVDIFRGSRTYHHTEDRDAKTFANFTIRVFWALVDVYHLLRREQKESDWNIDLFVGYPRISAYNYSPVKSDDESLMISSSIGLWTRCRVPFGPTPGLDGTLLDLSNAKGSWPDPKRVLSDLYVRLCPAKFGMEQQKAILTRVLRCVDWPNCGEPEAQRRALAVRVTETAFPRSLLPKVSTEFLLECFGLAQIPDLAADLESHTVAASELGKYAQMANPWIEDVLAPDWLRLQHPRIRCRWDRGFRASLRGCLPEVPLLSEPAGNFLDVVPWWGWDEKTQDSVARTLQDPASLELFLAWLESNWVGSVDKLSCGTYGGMEGANRSTLVRPFESQLAFFLRTSSWVPLNRALPRTAQYTSPFAIVLSASGVSSDSKTVVEKIDPGVLASTCEAARPIAAAVRAVLLRNTFLASCIGVIIMPHPEGCQAVFDTLLRIKEECHRLCRAYKLLCDNKCSQTNVLNFVACFFLVGWALSDAQCSDLCDVLLLLFSCLKGSQPLRFDEEFFEIDRLFSLQPLLFIPPVRSHAAEAPVLGSVASASLDFFQRGWTTTRLLIWDPCDSDVLHDMNAELTCHSQADAYQDSHPRERWLSLSDSLPPLWVVCLKDFLLGTLKVSRAISPPVFLDVLAALLRQVRDILFRSAVGTEEEAAYGFRRVQSLLSSSGVSAMLLLYRSLSEAWLTSELTRLVLRSTKTDFPVVVKSLRAPVKAGNWVSKSVLHISEPFIPLYAPRCLDVAHPVLRIFESIIREAPGVPLVVDDSARGEVLQNDDGFRLFCQAVGVTSIYACLATTVVRAGIAQEPEEVATSREVRGRSIGPVEVIRDLLKMVVLEIFDADASLACELERRRVFQSLAQCDVVIWPESTFQCAFEFLHTRFFEAPTRRDLLRTKSASAAAILPRLEASHREAEPSNARVISEQLFRARFIRSDDLREETDITASLEDQELMRCALNRRLRDTETSLRVTTSEKTESRSDSLLPNVPSPAVNTAALAPSDLRLSLERFVLELYVAEGTFCRTTEGEQSTGEGFWQLKPAAVLPIAEAALNLVDELCDVTAAARCRMYQRFLALLTASVEASGCRQKASDSQENLGREKSRDGSGGRTEANTHETSFGFDKRLWGRDADPAVLTYIESLFGTGEENKAQPDNSHTRKDENKVHGASREATDCHAVAPTLPLNTQKTAGKYEWVGTLRLLFVRRAFRQKLDVGYEVAERAVEQSTAELINDSLDKARAGWYQRTAARGRGVLRFLHVASGYRYRLRLVSGAATKEYVFVCPDAIPDWAPTSRQGRLGSRVRLCWKLSARETRLLLSWAAGGWEATQFFAFRPDDCIEVVCPRADKAHVCQMVDLELPEEYSRVPIHFKLSLAENPACHAPSDDVRSVEVEISRAQLLSILPLGYVHFPSKLPFCRSWDSVIGHATSTKEVCTPERGSPKKEASLQLTGDGTSRLPAPGDFILLSRSAASSQDFLIGRVDSLRRSFPGHLTGDREDVRILLNAGYVPGKCLSSLRIDIQDNPLELLLLWASSGPTNEKEPRLIQAKDVSAIVRVHHLLPHMATKAPSYKSCASFTENSGDFDYWGYCQSFSQDCENWGLCGETTSLDSIEYCTFSCRYQVLRDALRYKIADTELDLIIRSVGDEFLPESLLEMRKNIALQFEAGLKARNGPEGSSPFIRSAADIFSGAGGTSTGLEMAGFNVKWACERDGRACFTWIRNHSNGLVYESCVLSLLERMRCGVNNTPCPFGVYLLAGSSPCQGFSSINVKGGAQDLANRRLVFAVQEYIHFLQPAYAFFENVVGMVSKNRDKVSDFQEFIVSLLEIGYSIQAKVLNALDFGCPSERQRIILVATHHAFAPPPWPLPLTPAPDYVSIREAISDLPFFPYAHMGHFAWTSSQPKSEDEEGRSSNSIPPHIYNHNTNFESRLLPPSRHYDDHFSAFLTNPLQCDSKHPDDGQQRLISIRELLRGMSFPDEFICDYGGRDEDFYRQIGNAVPPVLAFSVARMIKEYGSIKA